ncbi:hypothetical protein O6H91_17G020600 [Diphasiastrum complanatum]|uniref:Uncharacterized protein n=1 Tax=Diphasiastrum complanatum TaxID=34168 RepID=A0ACC2B4U3_DIPCM|nr:hypothetical protein O6H91_17G020600 [Diphasiastrum complanatum]
MPRPRKTRSTRTVFEYLESPARPLTEKSRAKVLKPLPPSRVSNEFRKKGDRGGYRYMDVTKLNRKSDILHALRPQPGWRDVMLAKDPDTLQEYMRVPGWNRTDPHYSPLKRRKPWLKEKP